MVLMPHDCISTVYFSPNFKKEKVYDNGFSPQRTTRSSLQLIAKYSRVHLARDTINAFLKCKRSDFNSNSIQTRLRATQSGRVLIFSERIPSKFPVKLKGVVRAVNIQSGRWSVRRTIHALPQHKPSHLHVLV